jgi:hypothetical protein
VLPLRQVLVEAVEQVQVPATVAVRLRRQLDFLDPELVRCVPVKCETVS